MEIERPKKDLVEIFGHSPDDTSDQCRMLWMLGACPFTGRSCSKRNHDNTIIYGVCAVTTPNGDCIICPNRLYAEKFITLQRVAKDAFGDIEFMTFPEYLNGGSSHRRIVVALGMHSGHEIGVKSLSMDWVLAKIDGAKLVSYIGVEVQSLDITGNYRDAWHSYKNIKEGATITRSQHGLNWANVHKRLIPQLIRKSTVFSHSPYVMSGLCFIVPDVVYQKFEEIIGVDIPTQDHTAPDIITVYTWKLGDKVPEGNMRNLELARKIRFKIADFSERFISGPNLPNHAIFDAAIKKALGVA